MCNFIKWAKRKCKLIWIWRTIRCDVWLYEHSYFNSICTWNIFSLICGKGLKSFLLLIAGDQNSLNIISFLFKANSGNLSQLSDVSLWYSLYIDVYNNKQILKEHQIKYSIVDFGNLVWFLPPWHKSGEDSV